ncbi:MAG TPA: AEC family transporter [Gammaproteobacteria bacterium]|nr:AEC family transporter [Gammaproteobacteria bacterium]
MLRILEITVPVFGIILLGYVYARFRPADMSTANRLNVNIFTPALIFYVLSERVATQLGLYGAALGAATIVVGSGLIAWPLVRALGWPVRTVVPPAMFNNCGNMGLPLAVFAYGDHALPTAVIMFVVANAIQFTLGIRILTGRSDLWQLVGNPMVIATAAGLACLFGGLHAPGIVLPGINMLGNVAIPLMLISLGVRLTEVDLSHWRVGLVGGLLSPLTGLLIAVPWVLVFRPEPMISGLLILFGALPPAVLNYILSEHYDQEPARVASIVAIGNALSLVVIPTVLAFVVGG